MWLHSIARGVEEEPVRVRALPKSHSCSKTFTGRNMITTIQQAQKWLDELASELFERIDADRDENGRIPTLLTIHATVMPSTNRSGAECAGRRDRNSFVVHSLSSGSLDTLEQRAGRREQA
jgi:hypothetical protein